MKARYFVNRKKLQEIAGGKLMTVSDLARKSSVSRQSVSRIMNGHGNGSGMISESTCYKIAGALECNPMEFAVRR